MYVCISIYISIYIYIYIYIYKLHVSIRNIDIYIYTYINIYMKGLAQTGSMWNWPRSPSYLYSHVNS